MNIFCVCKQDSLETSTDTEQIILVTVIIGEGD